MSIAWLCLVKNKWPIRPTRGDSRIPPPVAQSPTGKKTLARTLAPGGNPYHPERLANLTQSGIPLTSEPSTPNPLPAGRSPEGLYLHLPFCFHKCHYCDFFSVVESEGAQSPRQDAFAEALMRELDHQAARHTLRPRTVFVGGGTPTYLRQDLWERLLAKMNTLGMLEKVEEFTVEANPETVTPELALCLAEGGVNRVSIGAQSFNKTALKTLERWHDPDSVPRAMDTFRAAGITNINLDLIFAIPGQTLETLDDDLRRLVELAPSHLSTYGLTYEPNTALSARLKAGRVTPIGEDLEREMFAHTLATLEAAGFKHYEVSNWAKTDGDRDLRCAHNLMYWRNRDWLGCGPAAASHLGGTRWKNAPNLPRYLEGSPTPPIEDWECLPADRRIGEELMLGLRLSEGVALPWLEQTLGDGGKSAKRRLAAIADMERIGMLERVPAFAATHLRLTRQGLFVADAVIGKLV